jgi:hypothetical protein
MRPRSVRVAAAAYEQYAAGAKQKCLVHLARAAREWREQVPAESAARRFFVDLIEWVRRACALDRQRPESGAWLPEHQGEIDWLRGEPTRLEGVPVDHEVAERLQNRPKKHSAEWLVLFDHAGVSATNNLAERALRPLVIRAGTLWRELPRAVQSRLERLRAINLARAGQHAAAEQAPRLLMRQPTSPDDQLAAASGYTA